MILNHVALPTINVPRSITFYRALGLKTVVEGPPYARFRSSDATTTLSLIEAPGAEPGGVTIYLEVNDVDSEVKRLQDRGVVFAEQPRVQPWNWKEARLKDPSGHSICLFWGGDFRLNP